MPAQDTKKNGFSMRKMTLQLLLKWYFLEVPGRIVTGYVLYAKAFLEIFSIFFLLKTLFSPWKSIRDAYPSNGLNLSQIAYAFSLNCTARGVGFVIRTATICFSVTMQFLLIAAFCIALIAWITFPVWFLYGLWYLILSFSF